MNARQHCNGIAPDVVARLHQHRDTIIDAWYQALVDVQFIQQRETIARQHLTDIFEQIVALIKAPSLDTAAARTIGAMLIEAGFDQPASLGCTVEVLTWELLQAMAPNDTAALLPLLLALQRAVVEGFAQRMRSRDMIEQHDVYTALRDTQQQTETRLQMLLQHLPTILITIDNAGIITFLDGKRLTTLNITSESIIGRSVYDPDLTLPDIQPYFATALLREKVSVLIEVLSVIFETWWTPLYGSDNTITGVTAIALDVTARMRFETQATELLQQRQVGDTAFSSPQPNTYKHTISSQSPNDHFLTLEEREVLQLVALGKTNQQIAATLSLSKQAIAKRLSKIFDTLGVSTRTEATARAVQFGLVAAPLQDRVNE